MRSSATRRVMRDAFGSNALADLAKNNMAMFGDAGLAFTKAKSDSDKKLRDDEVDKLRSELAALQAKVDRLDR